MGLTCASASLLCAAALAGAEVTGALGAPPGVLATARLLLLCVWARCWSGVSWQSKAGGSGCGGGKHPAPSPPARASRRTWMSAGVALPEAPLVMNLLKSRR